MIDSRGFDPVTGEYNATLTGDFVWSSVNVGEAMGVVMTPFTWSMMCAGFDQLNLLPGYASAGNIGGRMYQNVTVGVSALRALGQNVETISKEMGGVRDEYIATMDQYLTPLPGATFWAVLPGALRMRRKQNRGLRGLDAFLDQNPAWSTDARRRIEAMASAAELGAFWAAEMAPRSEEIFWRLYATTLAYSVRVGALRRELIQRMGPEDADALLSNVSRGDALLASMGPMVELARLARGVLSREVYLERWGHRSALETETSVPRPAEDPTWLDRELAAFARAPADVEGLLAAQRAEFEAAWARFRQRYPRRARSVRRRLDRAAGAAHRREATRSESVRLIWVARTWALRAGALTGLDDDVFYLTLDELLDLLAGRPAPTSTIPARRATTQRYRAMPSLPFVIRGRFDPFEWAADPHRRTDVFDSHGLLPTLVPRPAREEVILGTPGSAGVVEGLVRRLDLAEDGDQLQAGEVLVAPQTNIGWTLFFPRAAAVVTDVGAPLSHAAIVARELGIPAVVNCGDATARLGTGDRVRVDGVKGEVEVLSRSGG